MNEKSQNTALSGFATRVYPLAANGDCKSPWSVRRFSFSRELRENYNGFKELNIQVFRIEFCNAAGLGSYYSYIPADNTVNGGGYYGKMA